MNEFPGAVQVACFARTHVKVLKTQSPDGRTNSEFMPLLAVEDRVDEVAQMMGLPRDVAAEMLEEAQMAQLKSLMTVS